MPEALKEILAWLAALGLTAAVSAGAAFALFKIFADQWLSSKFNRQLEAYKHAQQKELERLRLGINTQLDRVTKLHQQEFEILPTLWTKLTEAHGKTAALASPFQSYPDLNRMTPAHLEEFLSKSELENWQKDKLLEETDRTTAYQKEIFWHRLYSVNKSLAEFHNYFIANGIFIQSELKSQLSAMSNVLHEVIIEQEVEHQYPNPRPGRFEKSGKLRTEGAELLKNIESAVYARLWREVNLGE